MDDWDLIKKSWLHFVVSAILSLGLWGAAFYFGAEQATFLSSAEKATGKVVAIHTVTHERSTGYSSNRQRDNTTYSDYPEITFTLAAGQTLTFVEKSDVIDWLYPIGRQVPVYYPRNTPDRARLGTFTALWWLTLLLGGGGLLTGALAVTILRNKIRERRAHPALTDDPLEERLRQSLQNTESTSSKTTHDPWSSE